MIFKFLILSDEVENFRREITIDADATFLDLYKAILECTGFSNREMASFFLCDGKWRKEKEITLVEMDTYSDEDSFIMEECVLSDFLEDEKKRMQAEDFTYAFSRRAVTNSLLDKVRPKIPKETPGTPVDVAKAIPADWLEKRLSLIQH